jgi:hypothetical protein
METGGSGTSTIPGSLLGSIADTRMPHIGHANHLCDMAEKGVVSLEQMKALARDPHFICKKCGRAANRAENLCEPVPL